MNKERILALAELIESQPEVGPDAPKGFYMNRVLHNCGTPSCIAGWAAWESLKRPARLHDVRYVLEMEAAEYLGFDPVDEDFFADSPAYELFYPEDTDRRTKAEAVAVLRHLAETGEVAWSEL